MITENSKKAWSILGLLCVALILPANAQAQDSISNRLNRLENEISTLGRAVYRNERPASATVPSFATPQASADATLRIQQLEEEIRTLTGKLEEQTYELRMLRRSFEKANDDLILRVQDLENSKGTAQKPQAAAEPVTVAPKPEAQAPAQTLGTLTTAPSSNQPVKATGTPEAQYDQAFSLLKQGQYNNAQQAFESFIASNPDHALKGNAQYWLGETFYVRGDFEKASRIFAEGFQSNPKGSKAPDNLLKLGIALAAMDKNQEACIALKQIEKEFPTGAGSVLNRSMQERQRLGCSE